MRLICILLVCALAGCSARQEGECGIPQEQLRTGDLAFRCGYGIMSRAVTSVEDEGIYSHVGIVVRDGGRWKIVHSVPAEGGGESVAKAEDIDLFFLPERARRGCLVHTGVRDTLQLAELALRYAMDSVRFDHRYDLADSSEVYCTELVWRVYRRVGMDLTQGRRRHVDIMFVRGEVILPEHIKEYTDNQEYYHF